MRYIASCLLAASLLGAPVLVGCDREVSHEETVKSSTDGTVKTQEKTVTQNPDGTLNQTTETKKTTNNP